MREVEAKFRVHPPFVLPPLDAETLGVASVAGPTHEEQRAVYYDTADLRLAREGVTLRRRTGGSDEGWHLKLPASPDGARALPDSGAVAREELQLPLTAGDEVPARFTELVTVWVRHLPVVPVATLVSDRSRYILCDPAGEPLALLTDDMVQVVSGDHVAGRFREIEVEDHGGGPDVLATVTGLLHDAGAVGGEFVPKVVRALGPQATSAPDPPRAGRVRPRDPARDAVEATLRTHVRAFMAQDLRVRRHEDDAVHQMRVSARRLRSALRMFRPLLDEAWAESLRAEIAWVATSLGEARDAEVMEVRLLADLDALPDVCVVSGARNRIVEALGGRLAAAQAAAEETLRTDRYLGVVDRMVEAACNPATTSAAEEPCAKALPPLVAAAWDGLDRRAKRGMRSQATDDDLHLTRIAAKRARYATEAVVPVFGKPARRLAAKAEQVQEILGEQHDAVVAQQVLRELAAGPRVRKAAFTFGVMHERQSVAEARARTRFVQAWEDVRRRRYRAWLRT